ncbi:MAG: phosphotransferase family protein [Bacilli bacterium]|nr:phosphotransferase family protein [Bacilli bacterium]
MVNKHLELAKKVLGGEVEILSTLHGGMMNEAYILKCNDEKYVFYIPTKQANEMVDRTLEKETQDIAEEIGVTRKTIYFDNKTGIKISKFIEGDSMNHKKNFDPKKVAELFLKLHSSKKKAKKNYNPFEKVETYRKEALKYEKELNITFEDIYDMVKHHEDELKRNDLVLCHNDSQRSNIIVDNNNTYWLIDFEFAMNNDPIYDIAAFGNDDVEDGLKVLKEYEKLAKVEDGFNRYCLWRMLISLQWYLVAIIKHYRGEGKVHNIDFLTVAEFFLTIALKAQVKYITQ